MSILTDLIDGVTQTANAGARTAEAKTKAIFGIVALLLVLLFLLILFAIEPLSATGLTIVAIVAGAYLVKTGKLG